MTYKENTKHKNKKKQQKSYRKREKNGKKRRQLMEKHIVIGEVLWQKS